MILFLDVVCHRFPNPRTNKARLLAWMKIIGLEDLDCHAVYSKKVICAVHFAEDCSSPGTKRLNANLYPTLKLPCKYMIMDISIPFLVVLI